MTLQKLKEYPLNKRYLRDLEEQGVFDLWNINVRRNRLNSKEETYIRWEIHDMTHYGNEPYSNEEMLDYARCFLEKEIYTEDQWNKYFIPAINEMLNYNNTFERWHPGYLIKDKGGKLFIVFHDYAEAFGIRDFTSLALCDLDSNENIIRYWAWADYKNYFLVSKEPEIVSKNLEKIRQYIGRSKNGAPIAMNSRLAKKLGFTTIHTYESANSGSKEGAIKL